VLVDSRNFESSKPINAPQSCATTNPITWAGAMAANVLLSARAIVIAGLASDVDAVNQYAAPIQADTRQAASLGPLEPMTTIINPAVAPDSESLCAGPVRRCKDVGIKGNSDIACTKIAPIQRPRI
jgi:hypothetical protein